MGKSAASSGWILGESVDETHVGVGVEEPDASIRVVD